MPFKHKSGCKKRQEPPRSADKVGSALRLVELALSLAWMQGKLVSLLGAFPPSSGPPDILSQLVLSQL
ncbi:hypothetical protein AALO_G00039430 [Alosa alosa]|uniref:Uncharacterized protein n=1 Tax=Alosa alosa TaxID=278164 RepID=A0AAV6H7X3_9TELE|nr:hypothetical protein AALO_G00039430 [Alosa alosa]